MLPQLQTHQMDIHLFDSSPAYGGCVDIPSCDVRVWIIKVADMKPERNKVDAFSMWCWRRNPRITYCERVAV